MSTSHDQLLLNGLRSDDSRSLSLLYSEYYASVAYYIKKNSGTDQDAEDIFQETIVILLQKIKEPDFTLTAPLRYFLLAISKNLWLKRLRARKKSTADTGRVRENFLFKLSNTADDGVRISRIDAWLQNITTHCQHVLKALFFYNEPMDRLMQKMGWKNKHTASNQKYKCLEQLKKTSEEMG